MHIGALSSIWPTAAIRADNGPIFIGARTSIEDGTVIHTMPGNPTRIGDACTIGHLVHLDGCVLEDHVLGGLGAMVLSGGDLPQHLADRRRRGGDAAHRGALVRHGAGGPGDHAP